MASDQNMLAALGIGPWTPTNELVRQLKSIPGTMINPLTPAQNVALAETCRRLEERREHTYRVYINGHHKRTVFSEEDAWAVISKGCLSQLHEVRDANDGIRPEFIPY